MDDRRRKHPWITASLCVLAVVLLAAVATDARAHARALRERQDLATAREALAETQFDRNAIAYALSLVSSHRDAVEGSMASERSRLDATSQALTTAAHAADLQDLAIGVLHTCLGGVRGALEQMSAHDTSKATADISAVAAACLALDGGTNGGLVYPFDFPDPFVLRVGGTYFAYATNSTEGNIQIIESTDLGHWSAVGNALPTLPSWAAPGGTWAPSVLQVGDTFVLYYAAVVAGSPDGEECISDATATQPQGPFLDSSVAPLICQSNLGGSIDPSPFVDADGTRYLEWKSNGEGDQTDVIWSERLNPSGTGFAAGSSPTALLTPDQKWESGVVEAPDLVLAAPRYFLFYSGNNWNSAGYAIGVAVCRGPLGPCTDPTSQPLLASGPGMSGPGGQSVFTDQEGAAWIAFDAWLPGGVGYPNSRALYLRPLRLSGPTPAVEPTG
jgi:hypothetical protein